MADPLSQLSIESQFGRLADYQFRHEPLTVPDTLFDWIDPAGSVSSEHSKHTARSHRQRVEAYAETIFNSRENIETIRQGPHGLREHADNLVCKLFGPTRGLLYISSANREASVENVEFSREEPPTAPRGPKLDKSRRFKLQLDALVLVVLCLPPTIRSLIFEAVPNDDGRHDLWQSSLAIQVAAVTMKIFGDRLESLTALISDRTDVKMLQEIASVENCRNLGMVKSLCISASSRSKSVASRTTLNTELCRWHALSTTVTHVSLWDLTSEPQALAELVTGFTNAKTLTLNSIALRSPHHILRQNRDREFMVWPTFLIDLRRQMPLLEIELRHVHGLEDLGGSAVKWILDEAIPVGHAVGFERQERLMEDFENFQFLWHAEDSERGELARKDRGYGKLVDMAMWSRGRGMGG
ncbi:uncharacterized protein LTR77_000468 [Saxophila tyrrhenica]|uniref:Uncharacterized protein n=1 Tax=Saxophila tyrrhenica TaxID=1690608 RepID=A0AAV9PRD9_9PEZI|nr:hypothetical protein LTR77_000468 [Saxophila tyrrhenica]